MIWRNQKPNQFDVYMGKPGAQEDLSNETFVTKDAHYLLNQFQLLEEDGGRKNKASNKVHLLLTDDA